MMNEFEKRVADVYRGIVQNIPEVQQFYADNFDINLDEQSIFLGALDPTVGEDIVSGKITPAQIGGEARRAGFTISGDFAQRLQRAGISQIQARTLFTSAQSELPRIQQLQERGGQEVEDEFTLEDFTDAAVFNDPDQLEQLRVLEAEEQSQFTPIGGLARRGGRVTGLTQQ